MKLESVGLIETLCNFVLVLPLGHGFRIYCILGVHVLYQGLCVGEGGVIRSRIDSGNDVEVFRGRGEGVCIPVHFLVHIIDH